METLDVKLKTLSAATLAIVVIEIIAGLIIERGLLTAMWATCAARTLDILVIISVLKGGGSWNYTPVKIRRGIFRGSLWSVAIAFVTLIMFIALHFSGYNPLKMIKMPLPSNRDTLILFFITAGIVGPVAEELFFRQVIYGFFRKWGVIIALIISTVIFVLLHPQSAGIPVTQIAGGILFAIVYEMEKNIFAPVIIHTTGNLAIFSLSLLF